MLVVEADVVSEDIQKPVIGIGLWGVERVERMWGFTAGFLLSGSLFVGLCIVLFSIAVVALFHKWFCVKPVVFNLRKEIMLCDEMAGTWVERTSQKRAEEQIDKRLDGSAGILDKKIVECQLND